MSVEKQMVNIALAQGLDTKTDPKQEVPGMLVTLKNATFYTLKSLRKRFGFNSIPKTILGGGSVSAGVQISAFGNELTAADGASLYSYSSANANQVNRGKMPIVNVATSAIMRNTYQQTMPDSCIVNGYQMFAWEDSSGGVRANIVDQTTGVAVLANQLISATAKSPKVLAFNNAMFVFYINTTSGNLCYQYATTSAPTTVVGETVLANDVSTTAQVFDATVASANTRIYVGYNNNATGISFYYLPTNLVASSKYTLSGEAASGCISVFVDSTPNIWCAYGSATAVKYFITNAALTTPVLARTALETAVARNITGLVSGSTATVYYEIAGTSSYLNYIRQNTGTSGGSVGSPSTLIRQMGLASKLFAINGTNYVLAVHDSTLQPTYFLIDGSAVCSARIAQGVGGSVSTRPLLPEVNTVSSGVVQIAYLQKDLVTAVSGGIYTQTGVQSLQLTFNSPISNVLALGQNLHFTGGLLQMYDGLGPVEHGFHLAPENLAGDYSPTYGGLEPNSTYGYKAVYEWTDNEGQIHRSSPSAALTVVTSNRKTSFYGNVTSGSASVTSISPGTGSNIGQNITNANVPANTNMSTTGATTGTLANNATGTATGTLLVQDLYTTGMGTVVTALTGLGYPTAGNQFQAGAMSGNIYIFGTLTSGSATIAIDGDINILKVGYGLAANRVAIFGSASVTISSINTTARTIVVSANSTVSGYFSLLVQPGASGTTSNGSPIITVSSTVAAWFSVGDTMVPSGNFAASERIWVTAVGATTITVSANATGSGSITVNRSFNPTELLRVGSRITSGGATDPCIITKIERKDESAYGGVYAYIITLNQFFYIAGGTNFTWLERPAATVTVPTLPITQKVSPRTPVSIVLYRTAANGTAYYRASSITSLTYNDVTTDTVTFFDNVSDYELIGNAQLYTNGGEVENDPLPPSNIIVPYRNRAVAVDAQNPLQWWFSKQIIPGNPVEWSLEFVKNIDQRIEAITAMGVLDDKLVFFGPNRVFVTAGDGPTPAGTNDDLVEPQIVSSDVGCSNQASVVLTPTGLMFQTPSKGIYLLDRSLSVSYIGAGVEAFNGINVTSAILVKNQNHVRFTLANGTTLVYDYLVGQWSQSTNVSAVGTTIFQNQFTYLKSDGSIFQENTSGFGDAGSGVNMTMKTGWISMAGIQGFQRARRLLILGDYKSPHTLTVNIYFDFSTTPGQTVSIPVNSDPGLYQFRIHLAQQKCEALQIEIIETVTGTGEGFALSNLALEVGVKKGLKKLPAAASYG